MPGRIRLSFGGATIRPPMTTSTFDADASVSQPSRNITVSTAPESAASWRISTLPTSEMVFKIAAPPAIVLGGHGGDAALDLLGRGRRERIAHHEHRRRDALRKRVIALGHAARHLQVDALIGERLARDQLADDRRPFRRRMRVRQADAVEAALQAREVLRHPERCALIDRDQLVDAVAVDEAAVQHRNLRVGEGEKLPVEVDGHRVLSEEALRARRAAPSARGPRGRRTKFASGGSHQWNHNRTLSHARPKMLAAGTSVRATSGNSPIGLPSSETFTVPTR